MKPFDKTALANRRVWEKLVADKCGFTQPFLDLNFEMVHRYTKGELSPVPNDLLEMYPPSLLSDVENKKVLCLASGGGQQSAVFGMLGARVTVIDIAKGQLDGDMIAADHYGYEITTIQSDMRDLSELKKDSFDIVWQAPSLAYIPDVRQVYAEVAAVLRSGGIYRVEFTNPATEFVDWKEGDGDGYRITMPYKDKERHRRDGAIEFRHHMSDIFNGLVNTGFKIQQVMETPHFKLQPDEAKPGSWEHYLKFISGFVVVAVKE
ncbi:MAG: class I SAM-dependent methyltransferase [Calditrichaeota bacterium]|jgi:SAM-dependent methyltransferase|nr:class I SAM-dependent methyltransferase [Calditrichota bacterium]MBT7617511.1 class I SAM-dependent methyltransferase [Calditrichota bacterium]MBT7787911.1 class I SAM-dependent methyltransferase [Calditrichota bacterium]